MKKNSKKEKAKEGKNQRRKEPKKERKISSDLIMSQVGANGSSGRS